MLLLWLSFASVHLKSGFLQHPHKYQDLFQGDQRQNHTLMLVLGLLSFAITWHWGWHKGDFLGWWQQKVQATVQRSQSYSLTILDLSL